jgi:CRISPR-associated endoribonuclease Cas6
MSSLYSRFLHEWGFPYGKRFFKLLTFSRIFGKNKVIKGKRRIVFFPPIYFYVSCVLEEVLASHLNKLLKSRNLKLGKNRVFLERAEVFEEKAESTPVIVKTISPVTIHSTKNGKAIFYNPFQETFYELLSENLRKKAKILGVEGNNPVKISPHPESKFKKAVVLYKGYPVEAWKGKFVIEAPLKAVEVALQAGIGDRNSQGFGMIVLEGEKR